MVGTGWRVHPCSGDGLGDLCLLPQLHPPFFFHPILPPIFCFLDALCSFVGMLRCLPCFGPRRALTELLLPPNFPVTPPRPAGGCPTPAASSHSKPSAAFLSTLLFCNAKTLFGKGEGFFFFFFPKAAFGNVLRSPCSSQTWVAT